MSAAGTSTEAEALHWIKQYKTCPRERGEHFQRAWWSEFYQGRMTTMFFYEADTGSGSPSTKVSFKKTAL